MPLPLAPIAGFALRYGGVALATYAFARAIEPGRRDQHAEDAHDRLEEGVTYRKAPGQVNATGRMVRRVQIGQSGPTFEIDASALTRIKVRKL